MEIPQGLIHPCCPWVVLWVSFKRCNFSFWANWISQQILGHNKRIGTTNYLLVPTRESWPVGVIRVNQLIYLWWLPISSRFESEEVLLRRLWLARLVSFSKSLPEHERSPRMTISQWLNHLRLTEAKTMGTREYPQSMITLLKSLKEAQWRWMKLLESPPERSPLVIIDSTNDSEDTTAYLLMEISPL